MLHPRHSRFSVIFTGNLVTQNLATGKNFGCSTLRIDRPIAAEFPMVENLTFIANTTTSIESELPGLSAIEVVKLVLLSMWLWCLLGVNFCMNGIGAVSTLRTQPAR